MTVAMGPWTVVTQLGRTADVLVKKSGGTYEWQVDKKPVGSGGSDMQSWAIAVNAWQQAATKSFNDLNLEVRQLRDLVHALGATINAFTSASQGAKPGAS